VVKSWYNCSTLSTDFWILKTLTGNQPDKPINTSGWRIPKNLQTADPLFYNPQNILWAPFSAKRCLTRLSELVQDSHPGAAEGIRKDFYVGDMLTGADSSDIAERRVWTGKVVLKLPFFVRNGQHSFAVSKMLGVVWVPREDYFQSNWMALS